MEKYKKHEEWFLQSDYDLETAEDMLKAGRYIYCVFMCHISLEKALKGLVVKRTETFPAKLHNLLYFVDKADLDLSDEYYEFLFMINKISVPTRYPEDLKELSASYTNSRTSDILQQTKEIQSWIKKQ